MPPLAEAVPKPALSPVQALEQAIDHFLSSYPESHQATLKKHIKREGADRLFPKWAPNDGRASPSAVKALRGTHLFWHTLLTYGRLAGVNLRCISGHKDFTYGVLYGTQKQSNKKDWHILRNLAEKLPVANFSALPNNRWSCSFTHHGIQIVTTIRIGKSWWDFLGGDTCLVELCAALIRACVSPVSQDGIDANDYQYGISDLNQITSIRNVPDAFNSALIQRSQIPWLFFLMRHFCDSLNEVAR